MTEHIDPSMPPGSVIITPAQMYVEIRAMGTKLDHLSSVIDPALSTIRDDVAEVVVDVADHETRIRAIERWRWLIAGAATAGGAVLAQVAPLLTR